MSAEKEGGACVSPFNILWEKLEFEDVYSGMKTLHQAKFFGSMHFLCTFSLFLVTSVRNRDIDRN